jgi:hypothetical protein
MDDIIDNDVERSPEDEAVERSPEELAQERVAATSNNQPAGDDDAKPVTVRVPRHIAEKAQPLRKRVKKVNKKSQLVWGWEDLGDTIGELALMGIRLCERQKDNGGNNQP